MENNKCKCQIPNTDLAGRCFKCGDFVEMPASNNQLPAHVQARICKDALNAATGIGDQYRKDGVYHGYIAGATAWAERAQNEIDRRNKLLEDDLKRQCRLNMPGISEQDQEAAWQAFKTKHNL